MENHLPMSQVRQGMKAVVLAGGYATRLWPITRHRPKMLLPLEDGTVIDRILTELEAEPRIDQIFISTNRRFQSTFTEFLAARPYEKVELSVEQTVEENEKMGVIGALAQLIEREEIDDDLFVIGGDNLFSFEISSFLQFFDHHGHPCFAAYDVGSRDAARSYGLVTLDGERVVDFQEKPDEPESTLVSIACYAFPRSVVPALGRYLVGDNNPDEPGWFIQWLYEREPVYAFDFDGTWFDIGTPDAYLDALAWSLDGDQSVAEGATVIDSSLGETVLIGAGATVRNSDLERTIVFDNAIIEDATLTDSIVDEHATVVGVELDAARVGAHSKITGATNDGD